MSSLFYFNSKELERLAETHQHAYASGDPFPHVVLDNFLPDHVLDTVLEEFPAPDEIKWTTYSKDHENRKLACEDDTQFGPFTRQMFAQFNSSTFVSFIEKLSGIEGLIPDPHFRGGGLHQTLPGGFLGIHADFNRYKRLKVDRRLNLLVYLNKEWKDEYGGHLELWDKEMKNRVQKVAPLFNRAVLFSTTDNANHGHPEPLVCPEGTTRKSLALYYYTNGMPAGEESTPHTTIFKDRPGSNSSKGNYKKIVKKILPPFFLDVVRAVRKK